MRDGKSHKMDCYLRADPKQGASKPELMEKLVLRRKKMPRVHTAGHEHTLFPGPGTLCLDPRLASLSPRSPNS